MKFDICLMNPPYNKALHLNFLEAGYNMLSDTGKMVIIEPATFYINIRKTGKAKKYDAIKELIKGHVNNVIIENYNKEFKTSNTTPFSITYIDKGKLYNNIKCQICGENKIVKSLYDINLIGNYKTIWTILNKLLKYDDMMINHIYNKKYKYDSSIYYAKFFDILHRCGCNDPRFSDNWFINNIYTPFYQCLFDCRENISNKVIKKLKNGRTYSNPAYSNTDAANICDTKIHLENFKYNVHNTKLFPFLGMLLIIQENPTPKFTPWLVDKKYTDEEIYEKFGFTDEEIKLIETTIKKYERYSPWFKRYTCGPSSVSDEEVQKYIDELNV